MRMLPAALATLGEDAATVALAWTAQAHVTHNNPLSDAGGLALTALLHAALLHKRWLALKAIAKTLEARHPEFAWSAARRMENPSGFIAHTVVAVFQAFFATDNFEDCLLDVVNRGGDADTTGAIAGMLAGAWYGEAGIPARWKKGLDATVAKRCREQALRLCRANAAS